MKVTQKLHDLGQSLWLDHIRRDLVSSGRLKHYIAELSVTGLTSNPSVFDCAIRNSSVYDGAICKKLKEEKLGEELYFDLALEDLSLAADLLRPIYDQTDGVDGWVSLEVSPLLTHDADSIIAAAAELYARGQRPNFFIKIPGTKEGLPAVEEAIFTGLPVNVTLLYSREHYLTAAEAYIRGIERRITAGLKPNVGSVASLCVNCWDAAVKERVPEALHNQLGIAMAKRTYKASRELARSPRWKRAYNAGARPLRLLWAKTEAMDPEVSDVHYVNALAAPLTVSTLSERTLLALVDHGDIGKSILMDGGDCEALLIRFAQAGIDIDAMAAELQNEEAASAVNSWLELMMGIASKSAALTQNQW